MSGGRVAVLSAHTSPLDLPGTTKAGGMNVYLAELSRQMAELGWEADIYTRRTNPSQPDAAPLGGGVQVVRVDVGPTAPLPPVEIAAHVGAFASAVESTAAERGLRYDLVHSHYWVAGLAGIELARRLGVPHATTFHTLGEIKNRHGPPRPPEQMEPAMRIAGERRAAACADLLICATDEERDFVAGFYGADPARIRIIAGGFDAARFHPGGRAGARERLARLEPELDASRGPTILFVGRLEPMKGADLLLEAFGMLPADSGAQLWIVGGDERDADERARLEAIARAAGVADRVVFHGAAPHASLPDAYRAADICAVPSTTESFGMVAVEAMACGTPVAATDVGGLRTTVRDGETGFLISPRRAEAFAARLEQLIAVPALREQMGQAAASSVLGYAWPRVARAMADEYEALIARAPSRVPCPEAESLLAGAPGS